MLPWRRRGGEQTPRVGNEGFFSPCPGEYKYFFSPQLPNSALPTPHFLKTFDPPPSAHLPGSQPYSSFHLICLFHLDTSPLPWHVSSIVTCLVYHDMSLLPWHVSSTLTRLIYHDLHQYTMSTSWHVNMTFIHLPHWPHAPQVFFPGEMAAPKQSGFLTSYWRSSCRDSSYPTYLCFQPNRPSLL